MSPGGTPAWKGWGSSSYLLGAVLIPIRVFILKRSTAGAFAVNMTVDNVLFYNWHVFSGRSRPWAEGSRGGGRFFVFCLFVCLFVSFLLSLPAFLPSAIFFLPKNTPPQNPSLVLGVKKCKPRPQNRISVPLKGSVQNFRRIPPSFLYGSPPPLPPSPRDDTRWVRQDVLFHLLSSKFMGLRT